VGTNCTAVWYDWGKDCTAVRYDWWVLTVQLCGMVCRYYLYSCVVSLVSTDCTDLLYVSWIPTVQLCDMINEY